MLIPVLKKAIQPALTLQAIRAISARTLRLLLTPMLISGLIATGGCAAISVKPEKHTLIERQPDYEETAPFYFFGLIGKQHFDVRSICFGREVELIRNEYRIEDLAIAAKTLFIYSPKTVRIWCK